MPKMELEPGSRETLLFDITTSGITKLNYLGFTGDTTNLSVDPMVVNDDTSKGDLDFHLQMFSPLIDRGDPAYTG